MSRDFQLFQQNLRTTALGVRFGRELLTNPDSISPQTITGILKAMGLQLPSEVVLARDAAQALVTGHAAVETLKDAQTLSDYNQAISMSVSSTKILTRIAADQKWVDADSAMALTMATDFAMLFASGGTDVGAWVRIAMNIGMMSMEAQAKAQQQAMRMAIGAYSADVKKQIKNFTDSVKELESGKIGIFGFLVKNVGGSQLIFDQVIAKNPAFKPLVDTIPGLLMLPTGPWTYIGHGASTTWWGESKRSTESITVTGLKLKKPSEAVDFLLDNLIAPQAMLYLKAREHYLLQGKADLFNVAVFALFEESFRLSKDMNVLNSFIKYQISPFEIGEKNIFKSAARNVAITTNFGVNKQEVLLTKEEMDYMDETGNISRLFSDRQAMLQMQERFSFGPIPNEVYTGIDWRNMANFIAVMEFLDLIYTDPNYETFKKQSKSLKDYDIFPKIQQFKWTFENVWKKSIVRRVNQASLSNVAYFLNAPIDSLQINQRQDDATIFKAM